MFVRSLRAAVAAAALVPVVALFPSVASAQGESLNTRVVVAAIDSGINPYHSYFNSDGVLYDGVEPSAVTQAVLAEFDIPSECEITVTRTGDFAADYAKDLADGLWDQAAACDVVWFTGTNILSKSFDPGTRPHMPDNEEDTHGTGVSASVLTANPDAVLLFLEGIGAGPESYAMTHPAVDLITTSYGFPGSLPIPGHITQSYTGTQLNGKLHFGACDNSPALAQPDGTCGPWWSIGVAGIEETQRFEDETSSGGRQPISGTFPDFVADFTQALPYCAECETGLRQGVGGTSFATPRSAGTFSKILLEARKAVGHGGPIDLTAGEPAMVRGTFEGAPFSLTNWQMRRALEEAAYIPEFGEYDPFAALFEFGPGLPINPVAPWAQISWGVITPETEEGVIELTLRHLGLSEGETLEKDAGYCNFNNGNIDARKVYWDTVNVGSETFLNAPNPDPYIFCPGYVRAESGDEPGEPATPTTVAGCPVESGDVVYTWEGVAPTGVNGTTAVPAESEEIDVDLSACDVSSMTVQIEWLNPAADLDFSVTDPAGNASSSGNSPPATVEAVAYAEPANGTYVATPVSFANADTTYTGSVIVRLADSGPVVQDADLDEVEDGVDNCPATFNPSQTDADGDGTGDACDDDAHVEIPLDTPTTVFEGEGTAGVTVSPDELGGVQGESSDGQTLHEFRFTIPALYDDYASMVVTLDWGNPAEYYVLDVITPTGQTVTALFVNTANQVATVALPVAGEYVIRVREQATATTSFTVDAVVLRTEMAEEPVVVVPNPISAPDKPRVIVGVIDSGINPYHDFYNIGSPIYPQEHPSAVTQEVLDDLGVDKVVELTRTGNMALDLAADAAIWDNVSRGELVHFKGTNIIAVSFAGADADGNPLPALKPDARKSPHGVGTSASVLGANPDAVILFVETQGDLANDASHDLAFLQPHVDMVSTSYGVGVPMTGFPLPENRAFRNTYEAVVENGKMHFSSGGNGRGLTPLRAGAGPWWSIGVSGIEEDTSEGDTATSGNFPDFVSDFSQDLPYCMDCQAGYDNVGGTSFSTPRAAGVASRILLEARTMLRHTGGITDGADGAKVMASGFGIEISNWFLRRALEQAAWLPNVDDFANTDPVGTATDLAFPINPAAPWLQMGWGDISARADKGVIPAALGHLNLGDTNRTKDQGACDFQTGVILARQEYWNNVAPLTPGVLGSEQTGNTPENDPFIYCANSAGEPASNDPGGQGAPEDIDGDGINSDADNCPFDPNADQSDSDGDGAGDACDDSFDAPDADNDMVADGNDNCPMTANPSQSDADEDGLGDACDDEDNSPAAAPEGPLTSSLFIVDGDGNNVTSIDIELEEGESVDLMFDASASGYSNDYEPEGGFDYVYDFGNQPERVNSDSATISQTYASAGSFTATVQVIDNENGELSGTASVQINVTMSVTVQDPATQTVAKLIINNSEGPAPLRVEFDGSGSFPGSGRTIVSYVFDYGDGNGRTTTDAKTSWVYTTPGTYTPTLEVIDSEGGSAKAQITVKVEETTSGGDDSDGDSDGGVGSTPPGGDANTGGGSSGSLGSLLLLPLMGLALVRRRRAIAGARAA